VGCSVANAGGKIMVGKSFRFLPMKTYSLIVVLTASFLAPPLHSIHAAIAPTDPKVEQVLYVTVDSLDPVQFDRGRNARETGQELIVATLKNKAAQEAALVHLNRRVIVLDDGVKAPVGAAELRLTWTGGVTADLFNGKDAKSKYLGVVSHTPLSFHPNFKAMQTDIRSHTMPDEHHDALLRADIEMYLYIALQRTARELGSTS
jgi:hypothetical protein